MSTPDVVIERLEDHAHSKAYVQTAEDGDFVYLSLDSNASAKRKLAGSDYLKEGKKHA